MMANDIKSSSFDFHLRVLESVGWFGLIKLNADDE